MKFWSSAAAMLLFAAAAHAGDYRVVYSPSLALEVYIDDVSSSEAQAWCRQTLPLRIVAGKPADATVLNGFLPQVGNLLQNQCSRLLELPWQLTDGQGAVLASGSAVKEQRWRPIVTAGDEALPTDLSPPANAEPLPRFALPGGCHFRTGWDRNSGSLFIPAAATLRCNAQGWLEGNGQLELLKADKTDARPVTFIDGYPLAHLQPAATGATVLAANNQRLVLARQDAADSWLLLPYDARQQLWSFSGTLLVKSSRDAAGDAAALKQRVSDLRNRWAATVDPTVTIHVLLVDDLHAELADPAIAAWRSVN